MIPPSGLFLPESMTSTQGWPVQGWALLQLLLVSSFSQEEETMCRQRGDREEARLYKDGDVILGGIFAFHSSCEDRQETYTHQPLPLQCTG